MKVTFVPQERRFHELFRKQGGLVTETLSKHPAPHALAYEIIELAEECEHCAEVVQTLSIRNTRPELPSISWIAFVILNTAGLRC